MISGVADQVDSTKVHVSVGVNGPLVPAWDRSVPVGGARKGHATEPVGTPSHMALDANGIGSGSASLNQISITRITIPERHQWAMAGLRSWDRRTVWYGTCGRAGRYVLRNVIRGGPAYEVMPVPYHWVGLRRLSSAFKRSVIARRTNGTFRMPFRCAWLSTVAGRCSPFG
jgi:hypothetical protein